MKKQCYVISLLFIVGLFFFTGCALAETGGTEGNITWSLSDDGVLTISGNGVMNDYDSQHIDDTYITTAPWGIGAESVVIVDGVTSIGNYAFDGCINLMSVTIPDSVTSIGRFAFRDCNVLTDITIPDSVTNIGYRAFWDCDSLTSVTILGSVTSIGDWVFGNCSNLTNVTMPDNMTGIGIYAFSACINLESITIPEGVTNIEEGTFSFCRMLTSVVIPDGVIGIEDGAFFQCSSLTSVTIPDSVANIGDHAFEGCGGLTSITIPDSVTNIGERAFSNCNCLTSIVIPNGVTSIGDYTFYECTSMTSVAIGDSVTCIGDWAFSSCISLTSVTLPGSVISIGNYAFYNDIKLNEIHIDSLESWLTIDYKDEYSHPNFYIPDCHLFIGETELTSVTIPDDVTSIGDWIFKNFSSLTSVTIPDSVTSIGYSAFSGCSSLTSVTIGNSVTSIGGYAFNCCISLTNVTIPQSITSIGQYAFDRCSNLREIHIDSIESWLTISYENSTSHPNYWNNGGCRLYVGENELTNVTIPDSVTVIVGNAFTNCCNLTSITIPNSVTSIEGSAFSYCSKLTSITIPDSVTSIGDNAFNNCRSLVNVMIGNSVTSIGNYAFQRCHYLKKLVFAIEDESMEISYGDNIFRDGGRPNIYCHMFTSPYRQFYGGSYTVYFLEDIDIDTIRTVTLPDDFHLSCGDSKQLEVYVFPADGESVTWSSSDPSVLTVADGVVTAISPGTAEVTATVGTVSDTVNIETYIAATDFELSATELWALAMDEVQLSVVNYTPANASADITWSVSDESMAQVDENGRVTTIMYGDVTVTATSEKGIAWSCLLHLFRPITAISLTAPQDVLLTGQDMQLTAHVTAGTQSCENHFVTFTSSDESVATVDSETGLVHPIAPGTVTFTAASANNKFGTITMQVDFDLEGLQILYLPEDLLEIGDEAFSGSGCQVVIIPDSCTIIGEKAFENCTGLLYVYIPSSVTTIGENAFSGCDNVYLDYQNE